MKQQEVFKKIGVIIKELSDQYEYLKTIDGQLNELELELFIANSHFLTDHVVILNKLNAKMAPAPQNTPLVIEEKPPVAEELPPLIEAPEPVIEIVDTTEKWEPLIEAPEPVIAQEVIEEKPVEEPGPQPTPEPRYFEPLVHSVNQPVVNHTEDLPVPQIDLETGSDKDNYSYIRKEPETIRHELVLDEADWHDEDESFETDLTHDAVEEQEPVIEEPTVEQPIIGVPPAAAKPLEIEHIEELKPVFEKPAPQVIEVAKDEVLTINERIMAQLASKGSNYTEQAGVQKIDDLKQSINLNDKLLYIKDLFNGYSLAYSEAIDILNRFTSFEEADTFLKKNYVAKNNWDSKPETTAKLYALLKRRYA